MTDEADVCRSRLDSNDLSYVTFIGAHGSRLTILSSVCEWAFGKHVNQIQDMALLAKTLEVGIELQVQYGLRLTKTRDRSTS